MGTAGTCSAGVFLSLLLAASCAMPAGAETPAPVMLFEAGAAGTAVSLADVSRPDVAIPLHWIEKNGKKADVVFEVSKLSSGRGKGVVVEFDGAVPAGPTRWTLQANEVRAFSLRARLLDAGTYRAVLSAKVITDKGLSPLAPLPITVTRTLGASLVEIPKAPANQVETGWFGGPQETTFTLKAFTSTAGIELARPAFQATRKNTVDAAEGVAAALKLAEPAAGASAAALAPGMVTSLPLHFTDIPGHGRYDVALRYFSEGYKPLDAAVVILVREPAGLALFFVVVGVLISFLMQVWTQVTRPVREMRRRGQSLLEMLAQARSQAGPAPGAEVKGLLDTVETHVKDRIQTRVFVRPKTPGGLDVYETLVPALPGWITLWQQLEHARPASVRAPQQLVLEAIRQDFIAQAPDPVTVKARIEQLDQLPLTIREAVKAALQAEIDKLDRSLAASPQAATGALRARLRQAADKLSLGQVEGAIELYMATLRSHLAEMAKSLRQRVDATVQPPTGVTKEEWQTLKDLTVAELNSLDAEPDTEQALAHLRRATVTYAQGLAASLLKAVQNKSDDVRQPVKAAVDELDAAVKAQDVDGVWLALTKVQEAYAKTQTQSLGSGLMAALVTATSAPGGRLNAQARFDLPAGAPARAAAPRTAAQIESGTLLGDFGISILSLAFASLGVLQGLWIPNPVWGGWAAYLAALMGGFAMDRVTQLAATSLRRSG